jgi:hypothetical protein
VLARFEAQTEYPGLYSGRSGPTQTLLDIAESPLELFFAFFPRRLFRTIAEESNRYAEQTVVQRAKKIRDSQPDPKESTFDIRTRLREKLKLKFQPHEYAVLFGLLIARMLQPRKQRLSTHWSTTSIGALAAGEFGKWMSRQRCVVWILLHVFVPANTSCELTDPRFDELMQHLHFSDNKSPQAARPSLENPAGYRDAAENFP